MMLVEFLWLALIVGGLLACLWYQPSWREPWFRLVRVPVPIPRDRPVWQRPRTITTSMDPGGGFVPPPGRGSRAGPSGPPRG